jgi:cation:H+ antiporter
VASGFEPENLVTGAAAALGHLPQIALGTVIGSAVFLLTAGLGLTLLIVPLDVGIPRAGALAMIATLVPFAAALWIDGAVSRAEALVLLPVAVALMTWLYRRSPSFRRAAEDDDHSPAARSTGKALGLLVLGIGVMVIGAELVVRGVRALLESVMLSETFLGMMVLLLFNLGIIALLRPLAADPLVLRFHAPFLIGCVVLVACALLSARRLGRGFGLVLLGLYVAYVAINLTYMWR